MKKSIVVAAFVLLLSAASADAGVELRFRVAFAAPDTPVTAIYEAFLVSGQLVPGSPISQHVTCYDISGLLTAASDSPDWVATIQGSGIDADDIRRSGRDDSPRTLNAIWTYVGSATIDASAGPVSLGRFRIQAVMPWSRIGTCIGQSSSIRGPVAIVTHP
jgi:hypothetical protein